MKIIYFCWGSAHSSVVAAAIHLGYLPTERVPRLEEVLAAPHFDKTPNSHVGTLFPMGRDENGRDVFILGLGAGHKHLKHTAREFLETIGVQDDEYCLVNCLPCVSFFTRLGGFTSRSLQVVMLGRPVAAWGVKRTYATYVELVNRVKRGEAPCSTYLDWSPPL